MSETFNVTFQCLACGTDPVTLTTADDEMTDDSIVSCKSCGHEFGRYGDVKAKARDLAAAKVKAGLRDMFRKLNKRK